MEGLRDPFGLDSTSPETKGSREGERPPLTAPSISLPKGGGAIRGLGEKFTANPATGTASMTVPLPTSPGRSGFGPQLSLTYDSGSGNGPFGFGWSLGLPMISRKTDRGLPRYLDGAESDAYLLSGVEDLVPVLDVNGVRHEDVTSVPGYVIHRYRPRVETLFARIERWTKTATGEILWRSISRENVTTWYGKTNNSRISDPADSAPGTPPRTFSWLICESYEDKGNAIVYEYAEENDTGVDLSRLSESSRRRSAARYIKRIKYGNKRSRLVAPNLGAAEWLFEVVFDYDEGHYRALPPDPTRAESEQFERVLASPRAQGMWKARIDPFSSYRAGFEVRVHRRCKRILMFHHFPDLPSGEKGYDGLVRSTEFDYEDFDYSGTEPSIDEELSHQGSTRFASYLRAATVSGHVVDGESVTINGVRYGAYRKTSLPPLQFSYSRPVLDDRVVEADRASIENLPAGIDGATCQWVDLDGEGVAGILIDDANAWYYKPNLGAGRFGALQTVGTTPSQPDLRNRSLRLLDLSGDGQLDVVSFVADRSGFYERTMNDSWASFRSFSSVPVLDWSGSDVHMLDLSGDGHADVLISGSDEIAWHQSLEEDGFGPARRVPQFIDDGGPQIITSDGSRSVYVADMTGDGLADVVRVRNGEVSYWPNLGYGQFGSKVTLDNVGVFDEPDQFEPTRLRLTDIDGSGTADIIYVHSEGVRLYFNQAGNRLSDPHQLSLPHVDTARIMTGDLTGNGTACLVWSSVAPNDSTRSLRYVDLMGGRKPHLLIKAVNNLGAETQVDYRSSTHFYLTDKQQGRRWATRLPFPVHVVDRVVSFDHITGNRFITRYAYHDGHFDGREREFRGFGLVDQWDTELPNELASDSESTASNEDAASNVPPAWTRLWFHTGGPPSGDHWEGPDGGPSSLHRKPTFAGDLTSAEYAEASRALKGSLLRREVFALDGTPSAAMPYTITIESPAVVALQRRSSNTRAVFRTHVRESVNFVYERQARDPRIHHRVVLEVDEFGNELRAVEIAYPRTTADDSLAAADQAAQAQTLATYTERNVTNAIGSLDDHRTPMPAEERVYELTPTASAGAGGIFTIDQLEAMTGVPANKRLVEHVRTLYRSDNLEGPLALRTQDTRGLPYVTYKLAFTPTLVSDLYGGRVDDSMLSAAGYRHSEGDANWWVPTGQVFYSPNIDDTPAEELANAIQHFFIARRFRDPRNTDPAIDTLITYDVHDLLLAETRDAVGSRITVGERGVGSGGATRWGHDYRVLHPSVLMDPNRNVSSVAFDTLGNVTATALGADPLVAPAEGDLLEGFERDLTEAGLIAILDDPVANADVILGSATTRIVHDPNAFYRTAGNGPAQQPAVCVSLARETHVSDLSPGEKTRVQLNVAYSDGFGRTVQCKTRATNQHGVDSWAGSGWTIYNNKGKPVRNFEPFFTDTHLFEGDSRVGVSSINHYDPLGRVVAITHPDHTWEKVTFDAWRSEIYDVNDTVLVSDPGTDLHVGYFFQRLRDEDYLPSWYDARIDGSLGAQEQTAAQRTKVHAATPSVIHLDPMGRAITSTVHNAYGSSTAGPNDPRVEERLTTRTRYDIEGGVLEITDTMDRVAVRYAYDFIGRRGQESTMEAGQRWILPNLAGQLAYVWDGRGTRIRTVFDALGRPIETYLVEGTGPETLVERVSWGETAPDPESANLRGKTFEHFDQAGRGTSDKYDFKGNLTHSSQSFAQDYKSTLDWSDAVQLHDESYESRTVYDALNKPVELVTPDGSSVRPSFNITGLLTSMSVSVAGAPRVEYVRSVMYDPKGRRTSIELGNGASTTYEYDALSERLIALTTRRSNGERLQALRFTHDPTGNVTHATDDATQSVFFSNRRVDGSNTYTYDALYRLIEASGREHLGLAGGSAMAPSPHSYNDRSRGGLPHPADGNALGRYHERYNYDAAGNLLFLAHRGDDPANPGWTRTLAYEEPSQIEASRRSNRLTSSTVLGVSETFSTGGDGYDANGNQLRMPHLHKLRWDFRNHLRMSQRQKVNDQDDDGVTRHGERTFYVYDSSGRRVRKVTERANGSIKDDRLYIGLFELYRHRGPNGVERSTLHVLDGTRPIALVETRTDLADGDPVVRYRLDDRLGSSSIELGEDGEVIAFEEYTPFGSTTLLAVDGQIESPKRYRFTGRERDEESGLSHHADRYYAPWLARWTSTDPAGVDKALNLYVYASDRPTALVDPHGRSGQLPETETILGAPRSSASSAAGASSSSSSGASSSSGSAPSASRGVWASITGAIGDFFQAIAGGLRDISGAFREWLPGLIAAPLAGLVDMLAGFSRTIGGIFSWKSETVLEGLGDIGLGFLSIFGLKELTEGFTPPPTRTDAHGTVHGLPTGTNMPRTLGNDLWDAQNATQADANLNGMHSWHAASNAHITTRVGPIGAIFLWLAGIYHETFDFKSVSGEEYWQGTTNHILDSLTDIVANTFGILIGLILPRRIAVHAASWLGNYIPGPGEPDPAFGGGGHPYHEGPRANDPRRAWGHYPPLRGPGTTRTPLPP